ncbi:MAG: hypothetical protein FWC48_02995 [Actinomycetia bacterium]|nr:hypothetical protein [Actinomycetes bacterium]
MLVEMSKVRIIGLKALFPQTLTALYDFGKIQFDDLSPKITSGDLPIDCMGQPEDRETEIEQLEEALQRASVVCQGLYGAGEHHLSKGQGASLFQEESPELLDHAVRVLDKLEPQIKDLATRREALEKKLAELEKYKPLIAEIAPIIEKHTLDESKDMGALVLLIDKKYESLIKMLEPMLCEISSDQTRVIDAAPDKGVTPLVVVCEKRYMDTIWSFLKKEHTTQIKLPSELEDVPITEAMQHLQEQSEAVPHQIATIDESIAKLGEDSFEELVGLKDALHDRLEEFAVTKLFGETAYTFVIEGYIPKSDLADLEATVTAVDPNVMIEEEPITPALYPEVPVEVKPRKGFMNSFRAALGLWGLPLYGQMDPTAIVAISFPFLFGMIVGDAGYGLLMILVCLALRKKMPDSIGVKNITGVLLPAGVMTVVFGCFYFEFFGNLAYEYIPFFRNIHPIEITSWFTLPFLRTEKTMMTTLLFLALGVGVFEVAAGLVLGIVNGKKSGHKKHMFEKGGLLLVIFAALLLVVGMMMPQVQAVLGASGAAIFRYVAYVVLGLGLIFAMFGGGIMGAVEMLEAVSHSASYIRIMAVGLVGALLADAANDLMFKIMPNIGGVVIAIVLHILNFAIILFSPSIHALRLTFLEFFGNFFERGSRPYRPFARAGKEEIQ